MCSNLSIPSNQREAVPHATVESLQLLVENIVNQSLDARFPAAVNQAVNTRFQSVQRQINASINERIINSQNDVPGKMYNMYAY